MLHDGVNLNSEDHDYRPAGAFVLQGVMAEILKPDLNPVGGKYIANPLVL